MKTHTFTTKLKNALIIGSLACLLASPLTSVAGLGNQKAYGGSWVQEDVGYTEVDVGSTQTTGSGALILRGNTNITAAQAATGYTTKKPRSYGAATGSGALGERSRVSVAAGTRTTATYLSTAGVPVDVPIHSPGGPRAANAR